MTPRGMSAEPEVRRIGGFSDHTWGPPAPETVSKASIDYTGGPCPVCGQEMFEVPNIDRSVDAKCLCGFRREKSPVPVPSLRPDDTDYVDPSCLVEHACQVKGCTSTFMARKNTQAKMCLSCRGKARGCGEKLNGEIIQRRMTELGLSRADFAKKVGMSYTMVSPVIKGKTGVKNPKVIKAMAKVMGVTREELIARNGVEA